jgi:hypothetical protein
MSVRISPHCLKRIYKTLSSVSDDVAKQNCQNALVSFTISTRPHAATRKQLVGVYYIWYW